MRKEEQALRFTFPSEREFSIPIKMLTLFYPLRPMSTPRGGVVVTYPVFTTMVRLDIENWSILQCINPMNVNRSFFLVDRLQ